MCLGFKCGLTSCPEWKLLYLSRIPLWFIFVSPTEEFIPGHTLLPYHFQIQPFRLHPRRPLSGSQIAGIRTNSQFRPLLKPRPCGTKHACYHHALLPTWSPGPRAPSHLLFCSHSLQPLIHFLKQSRTAIEAHASKTHWCLTQYSPRLRQHCLHGAWDLHGARSTPAPLCQGTPSWPSFTMHAAEVHGGPASLPSPGAEESSLVTPRVLAQ